jgi:2,3-bisphosphoglycerate-dependent phosphoglycerate mutase
MLPPDMQPRAESLRDVSARLLPYFYDAIVPDLLAGGCVLVVSHGNTLRALVKYLESIPDEQIAGLDIPTGRPLVYELGPDLRPDELGGQYLDPHRARSSSCAASTSNAPGALARIRTGVATARGRGRRPGRPRRAYRRGRTGW